MNCKRICLLSVSVYKVYSEFIIADTNFHRITSSQFPMRIGGYIIRIWVTSKLQMNIKIKIRRVISECGMILTMTVHHIISGKVRFHNLKVSLLIFLSKIF